MAENEACVDASAAIACTTLFGDPCEELVPDSSRCIRNVILRHTIVNDRDEELTILSALRTLTGEPDRDYLADLSIANNPIPAEEQAAVFESYSLNVCSGIPIEIAYEADVQPLGGLECSVRAVKVLQFDDVPTPPPTPMPTMTPTGPTTFRPTTAPVVPEPSLCGIQSDCATFDDSAFNICLDISCGVSIDGFEEEDWIPLIIKAKERWERIITTDR